MTNLPIALLSRSSRRIFPAALGREEPWHSESAQAVSPLSILYGIDPSSKKAKCASGRRKNPRKIPRPGSKKNAPPHFGGAGQGGGRCRLGEGEAAIAASGGPYASLTPQPPS